MILIPDESCHLHAGMVEVMARAGNFGVPSSESQDVIQRLHVRWVARANRDPAFRADLANAARLFERTKPGDRPAVCPDWMFIALRNEGLSYLRRASRAARRERVFRDFATEHVSYQDPSDDASAREMLARLHERFPPGSDGRLALEYRLSDLPAEEYALKVGLSDSTFYRRVKQGLHELKAHFAQECPDLATFLSHMPHRKRTPRPGRRTHMNTTTNPLQSAPIPAPPTDEGGAIHPETRREITARLHSLAARRGWAQIEKLRSELDSAGKIVLGMFLDAAESRAIIWRIARLSAENCDCELPPTSREIGRASQEFLAALRRIRRELDAAGV